jgi:hypothetical protein
MAEFAFRSENPNGREDDFIFGFLNELGFGNSPAWLEQLGLYVSRQQLTGTVAREPVDVNQDPATLSDGYLRQQSSLHFHPQSTYAPWNVHTLRHLMFTNHSRMRPEAVWLIEVVPEVAEDVHTAWRRLGGVGGIINASLPDVVWSSAATSNPHPLDHHRHQVASQQFSFTKPRQCFSSGGGYQCGRLVDGGCVGYPREDH